MARIRNYMSKEWVLEEGFSPTLPEPMAVLIADALQVTGGEEEK